MIIESKTIREFIQAFEKQFGTYLRPHEERPGHTKYFEIRPGRKKYSDWDLRCFPVNEVEFEKVQQMLKFIESYPAFDGIGHFMTDAQEFISNGSHVSSAKLIQTMAIMKNESYAPFLDLSLRKVKNSYVKRLFQKSFNEEFISWAMLTSWRKIKNEDFIGMNSFVWITVIYLLPHYSGRDEQRAILQDPGKFFTSKLGSPKYKRAVEFLIS